MHELDADGLAVSAAQNADDLAQRGEFQPQHLVEEDRPVVVGLGESVRARIELLLRFLRLEPERIELGVEMAADAIGADQHQRADGIARRLLHLFGGQFDAARLRRGFHLVAGGLRRGRPFAGQRSDQLAVVVHGPMRLLPGGAAGDLRHLFGSVLQALKEFAPFRVDALRVLVVTGLEVIDVGSVAAIEERGQGKSGIRVLAGHGKRS